jgi:hypothetical protein
MNFLPTKARIGSPRLSLLETGKLDEVDPAPSLRDALGPRSSHRLANSAPREAG